MFGGMRDELEKIGLIQNAYFVLLTMGDPRSHLSKEEGHSHVFA